MLNFQGRIGTDGIIELAEIGVRHLIASANLASEFQAQLVAHLEGRKKRPLPTHGAL